MVRAGENLQEGRVMAASRREFLKRSAAATAGVVVGAPLLSACGGSGSGSSPGSSASSAATGTPVRGGRLRLAITGGGSSDQLNPLTSVNNADYARARALFNQLASTSAAGDPVLELAEEITPNRDLTEWTVRLRKGVLFHDGKEMTADDLIYTLQTVFNPKAPATAAGPLKALELKRVKKRDPYTLTLPLSSPSAILVQTLAAAGLAVIPVGFDTKRPIGTGPFRYVSFTPGAQSTFDRFADYWDAPKPYIDQLVITDYTDETSQLNALTSGQADLANGLSVTGAQQAAAEGAHVVYSPGGGWNPFTMRVDVKPFSDVRVRQAMRLIVDRPQMQEVVFGGHGELASDVFGIWAPEFDHDLPQRHQDIPQAKSLLKAAGYSDLTVQLTTSDIAQGVVNMAQIFVEQAKSAGVTVTLNQVTPTDFYGPNYLKWVFAQDYWYYNYYLGQVSTATLPSAPFNETHFDNPTYNSLFAQAVKQPDLTKRADIAHEMQMIDYNEGGYIIPFFVPVIDGFAVKVHGPGVEPSKVGASFNDWDFSSVWIKS